MDMELGQLFSKETQAVFFNYKEKPIQVCPLGVDCASSTPPRITLI
jgi:hypothetical protein